MLVKVGGDWRVLPDLSKDWRRQPGLHEESPGLSSSDEAVSRADTGELLHVTASLLGQDHPRVHLVLMVGLGLNKIF